MSNYFGMKRPETNNPNELKDYITALERRIEELEGHIRLLLSKKYSPSSERTVPGQLQLPIFNEAEAEASPSQPEPTYETVTYTRRKTPRGPSAVNADNLSVDERIDYELPEEKRVCPQCSGLLHEMSTQSHKELEIIPAQIKVVEHVQHIYSCRHCEKQEISTPIIKAPVPASPIPGSMASPSALAYVMNQKYVESMPLYRQEQSFEKEGITLTRQTLANWIIKASEIWLELLYQCLYELLLSQDILYADETPVQVLQEPGRSAETNSYMWVYLSGRHGPQIILYDYQQTRAGKNVNTFLAGFSGYLHCDGYAGYEGLPNVKLVGCWAHARRKFDEAIKALPSSARSSGAVSAEKGLDYCNRLFKIERSLDDVSPEMRLTERSKQSQPILDEFKEWLDKEQNKVLPKSGLGKAITYCLNQWDKLTGFMQDGRLEISNNRAENYIRPFVLGRKNWLFANTPQGARASAVIYSIVQTAKANNLNPYRYLKYLFENMPNMDVSKPDNLTTLLPWSNTIPEECKAKTRLAK